jgi:hypothetical protein
LLLLDLDRRRLEGPDIVPALQRTFDRWHPAFIAIEKVGFQTTIIQTAQRAGIPVRELDKDKITRALPAAARMEGGGVYWKAGAPPAGSVRRGEDRRPRRPPRRHPEAHQPSLAAAFRHRRRARR